MWRSARDTDVPATRPRSVAVLPLKSFGQAEDDDLRLRITDALITTLGSVRGIAVRPTNSILVLDREDLDPLAAGEQLDVDAVLDGRMQTEGDRLRVTLQLLAVGTGEILWSGQFDGAPNRILDLQDRIASQLLPQLAPRGAFAGQPTANAEAYEYYLKGRHLWNKRTQAGITDAIQQYREAIALDPNFALAHAGLADAYSMLVNVGGLPSAEGYGQARKAAEQALALDPALSEGYSALGWILGRHEFKWAAADDAFARAIALNPNNAEAHHWRALNARALGKVDEYLASMEAARQLAPLTRAIARNYYDVVLEKEGCASALQYLERYQSLYDALEPERAELMGKHDVLCGDYAGAIATIERLPVETRPTTASAILAVAYARTGRRQAALEIVKRLGVGSGAYFPSYVYVALGDFDAAIACLEGVIAARQDHAMRLKFDPFLAPLRSDARFAQLLKKMNLPE